VISTVAEVESGMEPGVGAEIEVEAEVGMERCLVGDLDL